MEVPNPFAEASPTEHYPDKDNVWNFQYKLVPIALYPTLAKNAPIKKKTIRDLMNEPIPSSATLLLSFNNLLDTDLPPLAELTRKISPAEVNLSHNRIHGYNEHVRSMVDKSLKEILQHTSNYVNICGNPIASADRVDFFRSLTKDQLGKLIWIPEAWLYPGHWKAMIDAALHPDIQKTHEMYYSRPSKWSLTNLLYIGTWNCPKA